MRKSIIAVSVMLSMLTAASGNAAQENSFAQKDAAGHLFAYLNNGDEAPQKEPGTYLGMPNTGLYVAVKQKADQVLLRFEAQGELPSEVPIALNLGDNDKASVWPMFVRRNGFTPEQGYAFLLGVVVQHQEGYSGGSADDHWLHLFSVDNPGSPKLRANEVLSVPLGGDKLVRGCFSEQDEAKRKGVCHDTFAYEASLRLDEANNSDWPVFVYQSEASVQPGMLTEVASVPERELTADELANKTDASCSFQRKLSFNAMSHRYEMDTPVPDCGRYFAVSKDSLYK